MIGKFKHFMIVKAGSMHWWGNKATSIILIPLVLYFLIDLSIYMGSQAEPTLTLFLNRLFDNNSLLIYTAIVVMLLHIRAGMEVIIEDYVHGEKIKIMSILFIRILTIQNMRYLFLYYMMF